MDVFESIMLPSGPQEVPGASHAGLGHTHLDSLLRVVPRPGAAGAAQLQMAANMANVKQVRNRG